MTVEAWRLPPFLRASVGLHAAGAAAAGAALPSSWPVVVGGLLLDHGLIGAAAMWPRSTLPGSQPDAAARRFRREVALTFDDGPHPK